MLIDSTNSAHPPVGEVHVMLYNTGVYTENHCVTVRVGVMWVCHNCCCALEILSVSMLTHALYITSVSI